MEVNLTKRIDTPNGRRFCPVVLGRGGRLKPDWGIVSGCEEKHSEGAYYLDWYEDEGRKCLCVGDDATAASNSRDRKQSELEAIGQGLVVTDPVEEESALACDHSSRPVHPLPVPDIPVRPQT